MKFPSTNAWFTLLLYQMLKSYELFQADEKRCIFVAYQFPIISLCWMRFATFKFRPCAAGTARILESIWPLPLILPLINQNNAFTVDVFCLNNAKAIPYLACTLHPARDFGPSLRECQSQEYFRFSLFSSVVRCLTLINNYHKSSMNKVHGCDKPWRWTCVPRQSVSQCSMHVLQS